MRRTALGLLVATLAFAQTPRTVWDGAFTEAQAARGALAFGQRCAGCHSLSTDGRSPLVGDVFWKSFSLKTVADVYQFVSVNMPNGAPGSLNEATYTDIVAAMLKSNGLPAGATELLPKSDVKILPQGGGTALPANALVRVVGCLARKGADWEVTSATAPERAERGGTAAEDAARPLGKRSLTLKFVLTNLSAMTGARVTVTGLLMGNDGVDGINVTTVNRVAPTCP